MPTFQNYSSSGENYTFSKGPKDIYHANGDDELFAVVLNAPQQDADDEWGGTERIAKERIIDEIGKMEITLYDPKNDGQFGLIRKMELLIGTDEGDTGGVFTHILNDEKAASLRLGNMILDGENNIITLDDDLELRKGSIKSKINENFEITWSTDNPDNSSIKIIDIQVKRNINPFSNNSGSIGSVGSEPSENKIWDKIYVREINSSEIWLGTGNERVNLATKTTGQFPTNWGLVFNHGISEQPGSVNGGGVYFNWGHNTGYKSKLVVDELVFHYKNPGDPEEHKVSKFNTNNLNMSSKKLEGSSYSTSKIDINSDSIVLYRDPDDVKLVIERDRILIEDGDDQKFKVDKEGEVDCSHMRIGLDPSKRVDIYDGSISGVQSLDLHGSNISILGAEPVIRGSSSPANALKFSFSEIIFSKINTPGGGGTYDWFKLKTEPAPYGNYVRSMEFPKAEEPNMASRIVPGEGGHLVLGGVGREVFRIYSKSAYIGDNGDMSVDNHGNIETTGEVQVYENSNYGPLLSTQIDADGIKVHQGFSTFSVKRGGLVTSFPLSGEGLRAVYSNNVGGLVNSSSDVSMKTNIVDLDYGLKDILDLRPVSYNWNKDNAKNLGEQTEIGLIAQEVAEIIPEVVGSNSNGTLSLDYARLTVILVKAVKDLYERRDNA